MRLEHPTRPDKRLTPQGEAKQVTTRKNEAMQNLLEGRLDDVNPKERPTIIDFQGLSPDSTEEEFLRWIEREIGISPHLLESGTEETAQAYRFLNDAYQRGKIFLQDTLKYSEKELSIGPTAISSKKDIIDLLQKTVFMKEVKGLSKAPLYCRLVKSTVVAYETLKHDAAILKESTAAFEGALVGTVSANTPLTFLREDEKGKHFYVTTAAGSIKGTLTSRGKDLDKAMLRFVTRPDSSAKSALEDGIGFRISMMEDQAIELVPILCKFLNKTEKVAYIHIENVLYFSGEQINIVKEKLLDFLSINDFRFTIGKNNATSMGDYKAVTIKGILQPSEAGKTSAFAHARQFEIQIVSPLNRNERGKLHHSIYDIVKFVTARTRLDGRCPEHIFLEFIKEASIKSGMSEKTILHYLVETNNSPIVKINDRMGKTGKPSYVSNAVYSRWDGFGWIDASLIEDIESAKARR